MMDAELAALPEGMWTTLKQLAGVSHPVTLLTRHSIREQAVGQGFASYDLPLTAQGRQLAYAWGEHLIEEAQRSIVSCISSPIQRCVDTAQLMLAGQAATTAKYAQPQPEISTELLLVEPGSFVHDVSRAGPAFLKYGALEFINAFLRHELQGVKTPSQGSYDLLKLLFEQQSAVDTVHLSRSSALHLAVSHDTILAALISVMMGRQSLTDQDWPEMMEGMVLWFEGKCFEDATVHWLWRGQDHRQSMQHFIQACAR